MLQVPLGTYVPGSTIIHRMRPGLKFLALIAFVIVSSATAHTWPLAIAFLTLPLIGYVIARIPARVAWTQLSPPLPILAMIFAFQWWQLGLSRAGLIITVIYAAIVAATLLTLTTKVSEMMDAVTAGLEPFRRFGLPVDAIALAISLTIRLIPLQLATVKEVLDARKARGAEFSIRALGTPVIIRSIRRAENIGDALIARGVGD